MTWLDPSKLLIGDKIYHISNPEWIKNIIGAVNHDNDTTKDKEVTKPA
jgi:hypothetical protein